jgi:UDPglucose 6-dehydrogenase
MICVIHLQSRFLSLLKDHGAKIRAYDPTAKKPYDAFPWIEIGDSARDVCEGADVLAVLTEWSEFAAIDPVDIAPLLKYSRVVDGRNALNREKWIDAGFSYRGVGR